MLNQILDMSGDYTKVPAAMQPPKEKVKIY